LGRQRSRSLRGRRSKGALFVDEACILCTVCSELAPQNFRLSVDEDHDICFQQPTNAQQLAACISALDECPAEAIGDDG
jgi:ferredoxin